MWLTVFLAELGPNEVSSAEALTMSLRVALLVPDALAVNFTEILA